MLKEMNRLWKLADRRTGMKILICDDELLAAEKIGASLLCRDNTIQENVDAVKKSGAKMIIAQDFLSHEDLNKYRVILPFWI